MIKHKVTLAVLIALVSISYAESPLSKLQNWFSSITNTEEHLLHLERIGPYILSADGQRLLPDPYLKLEIKYDKKPLPADAKVSIKSILYQNGPNINKSYMPTHDGKYFVIEPLDLSAIENWNWDEEGWLDLSILIDGPAGKAEGKVGFEIYPPKPNTGILFRVLNIAIPIVLLVVFASIYKIRKVKLIQADSD